MSNSVAVLPTGTGVTVIAEHHHRRDDPRSPPREQSSGGEPGTGERQPPDSPRDAPPPPAETAPVPAETLFAATLLANTLPIRRVSADEMRLRQSSDWVPPASTLRLKDKLI